MSRFLTALPTLRLPAALGRLGLALTVCISLLQTPVPIFHDHADFESEAALSAHVTRRHAGEARSTSSCHWHFVLPGELAHDAEEDANAHLSPHDVAVESDYNSPSVSISLAVTDALALNKLLTTVGRFPGDAAEPRRARCNRTAGDLLPSVRACAVLCILRC